MTIKDMSFFNGSEGTIIKGRESPTTASRSVALWPESGNGPGRAVKDEALAKPLDDPQAAFHPACFAGNFGCYGYSDGYVRTVLTSVHPDEVWRMPNEQDMLFGSVHLAKINQIQSRSSSSLFHWFRLVVLWLLCVRQINAMWHSCIPGLPMRRSDKQLGCPKRHAYPASELWETQNNLIMVKTRRTRAIDDSRCLLLV